MEKNIMSRQMKVLIAEDEPSVADLYKISLADRGHEVLITSDGSECLETYDNATVTNSNPEARKFDAIVLDYSLPIVNGLQVAKKILSANPKERIVFASGYVVDTLTKSVSELGRIVELVQKPFEMDGFIDLLEDVAVTRELEELNVDVKRIKDMNPSPEQLRDLLHGLKKIQKGKAL
jgi:CheY-like chemotaxis protein